MPAAFPTDTHPADDLDLEDVVSDFAFGRPCHIPPGIVGDATRLVFGTHWPALLRTVRAYRKRVDGLTARLAALEVRLDEANERTAVRCRALMASQRHVDQLRSERNYWRSRALDAVSVQRYVVGVGDSNALSGPVSPAEAPADPGTRETPPGSA